MHLQQYYIINHPLPVTESNLAHFVAFLFKDYLSRATVKNYLAAVRYTQITLGLGDPEMSNMPKLEYVMKGSNKVQSLPHPALTSPLHRIICNVWRSKSMAGLAESPRCLDVVGNSNDVFLQFSEEWQGDRTFTIHTQPFRSPLLWGHSHRQYMYIGSIVCSSAPNKALKIDPYRKGVSVYRYMYLEVAGGELCPVAAILDYNMVRRRESPA